MKYIAAVCTLASCKPLWLLRGCGIHRARSRSGFVLLSIRRFTARLQSAKAESLFDCLKNRDEEGGEEDAGGLPAVFINQESSLCIRQRHRDIDCLRLRRLYSRLLHLDTPSRRLCHRFPLDVIKVLSLFLYISFFRSSLNKPPRSRSVEFLAMADVENPRVKIELVITLRT